MSPITRVTVFAVASAFLACAQTEDSNVTFRSDVALIRVDAQVLDRSNRALTNLHAEDFVLLENGRPQEIRSFAREEIPVDILLLVDVSSSMRPHVERLAAAADGAMRVLSSNDQVGLMVFDRGTNLRMPFRRVDSGVARNLQSVLSRETFDGGTDITRGLLDAAAYVTREARPGSRRAIVILTDDQTERDRDEQGVGRALTKADAVLSALLAPDALGSGRGGGVSWPGSSWPGGGGGGLGGIILGRRGPMGGGPGVARARTRSAGTAEIARQSGGDSLQVDDAAALETTLTRIRQRYALYFQTASAAEAGRNPAIEVELTDEARRRYPDAEVRYRRTYSGAGDAGVAVASAPKPETVRTRPAPSASGWPQENGTDRTREADRPLTPSTDSSPAAADKPAETPRTGGWRRARPDEIK